MDYILKKYLPRIGFDSYEDFKANYTVNVTDDFNFGYDVVDAWAEAEPEKIALVWCNAHGEDVRRFTFSDVRKYSNMICNYLVSLGIKKGDRVMLMLKVRYEYWFTCVALHKIGAVCIPATYQLTEKDIIYRSNRASVKMIICAHDENVIRHVENSVKDCPTIKYIALTQYAGEEGWIDYTSEYMKFSDVFPRPEGDKKVMGTDDMLIYFTSGTTSMPKMVRHIQNYPLGHILTAKYWQQVEENGLHLTVADSGWAKFSWGMIYGQWISGSSVLGYAMDKFKSDNLLSIMEKFKITTFCAPATMYRFMIQEDLTKYDLSSIHHCCMAGEPLNPEVFNKWKSLTGHMLYEGFGQTESPVLFANYEWIKPIPGSMGKPSPVFDIHIVNENGKECEIGEDGEVVIYDAKKNHPVGLTVGYFMDDEANERIYKDGMYHTGDIAWRDESGYYTFVGRTDDVIKCSAYRISPFEVESVLMTHPAIVECAVTAAPDPIRGQVVKATIVLARGYAPSDELAKEIQKYVKSNTAPYKYPRIISFVDELPKTTSGKIKRSEIRASSQPK